MHNELALRGMELSFDYYDNDNLKASIDNSQRIVFVDSVKENIKQKSPFATYYNNLLKTFAEKATDVNDVPNEYYNPKLFQIISNRLYLSPMWTGFIFKKIGGSNEIKRVTRLSNNPVENWFNTLKNNILQSHKVMPSELVGSVYNKLLSKYLEFYYHQSKEPLVGLDQETENWQDKEKKRKKNNEKMGYHKKSNVFGVSKDLIQPTSAQISKTFDSGR